MKKGSWVISELGDVCEVNPRRPVIDRKDTSLTTFVPMSAVDDVHGVVARPEQRPFASVKKGYTFFTENDVIFAKITPCMENGKQAIARNLTDGIGFGSTEFHVIRPNAKIMAEWVWYFVRQSIVLESATKFFTGTVGQQRVPDSYLKSLEIPIPPIPEQQRIVSVLDEAFVSIEQAKSNAEQNLVNARELFETILDGEFENAKAKWESKIITELCEIGDGNHGGNYPKADDMRDSGVPFIRSVNLVDGHISDTDIRFISEEKHKSLKKGHLKTGDVLFTNRGEMGKSAVVDSRYDDANLNSQIAFFRCSEHIFNWYLYYILQSPYMQSHSTKSQTGSALQQLPIGIISKFKIPLPPLADQRAIVGRLEALSAETSRLEKIYQQKVESLEELKKSVLQKAFSGEL